MAVFSYPIEPMNAQLALSQAINAAKSQNWSVAVDLNQQLLEQNPADLGALNRLGIAFAQLGKLEDAKQAFEGVLSIDKANAIAKKNLQKLKTQPNQVSPSFTSQDFIEEPGRTKTADLHRLAGKPVLESLIIGQECELKPKHRYISVEMGNTYIGALPDDISFRLAKLIETGNTYYCCIRSVSANNCSVYIKELTRSAKNAEVNSFPVSKSYFGAAINELEELLPEFEQEMGLSATPDADSDDAEPAEEEKSDREREREDI